MSIFSELDQISDRETSPKRILSAGKKAVIDKDSISLSDRVIDYKYRSISFIKRYEQYLGKPFDYKVDSFKALASWMVEHIAPSVSKRSWRSYKLCLSSATGHPAIEEILSKGEGYSKSSQLSRFQRQKHLKDNDLSRLILTLNDSLSIYKEALTDWLKATIVTGLRPNEWGDATIVYPDGLNMALKVRTIVKQPGDSKTTCPEYRFIPLSHLTSDDLETLNAHLSRYTKAMTEGNTKKLYEGCRKLLHYTGKITFKVSKKKSINLYSARHQFCANLKSANFDKESISALMGQSSYDIQSNHYASRSVGSPTNLSKTLVKSFNLQF